MKKVLAIAVALTLLFSISATAKVKINLSSGGTYLGAKGMGIGVEGGWPSNGLTFKTWLSDTSALQLGANWYFGYGMGLSAAYLMHNFEIIEATDNKFPLYWGVKGAVYFGGGFGCEIMVPLGIAWIPKEIPIDVFFQFEPGITLVPTVYFWPGGSAGIRWWFK